MVSRFFRACHVFWFVTANSETHVCALLHDRHRLFLDMDKESPAKTFSTLSLSISSRDAEGWSKTKPLDLPIFE
jgi:hypothetical protein